MFIDYRNGSTTAELDTDVCIIGGGPAGLSVAHALANTDIDVCLLESGTWTGDRTTQDLCEGDSVGDFHLDPGAARLRAFGGCLRVWGNGCAPLAPLDLEAREWVPESGWPIDYDALLPFYERARVLFGIDTFKYGRGEFLGHPKRTPSPFDTTDVIHRVSVLSAGDPCSLHRRTLERARNVQIVLNATVREIVPNAGGTAIERVEIQCPDGTRTGVRARHVVLACGGIENARLLLLSDSVTPSGLGNDYDQVGRYFMDHPSMRLGRVASGDLHRIVDPYEVFAPPGISKLVPHPCLSDEAQRNRGLLNARIRTFAVDGETPPGLAALRALRSRRPGATGTSVTGVEQSILNALHHGPTPGHASLSEDSTWRLALRSGLGAADLLHALARKVAARRVIVPSHVDVVGFFEQAPHATSRITLGHDLDAVGQRRVRVDWRMTPLDIHTFHAAGQLLGDTLARAAGGHFEPEEWLRTRSTPTTLHGTAHHIGTTRMADSPRRGVVDRHCRVHGIDNLHIAGSSVFPTGGWVFPTLTIAALSLRLADRLAARLADERGSMWLGATTSATEPSRLHARELAALPGASRGRGIVHVADRDGTRAGT